MSGDTGASPTSQPSTGRRTRNADCLREELIHETLSRAASGAPFYRDLYASAGLDVDTIRSISDLDRVPIVSKAQLREAGARARCLSPHTVVTHVQNTSGTTSERFLLYRSLAETRFINDFFSDLAGQQGPSTGPAPLLLQLQYPYHGTATAIPGRSFVLTSAVHDPQLMDHAVQMLTRSWDIPGVEPRVSGISGGTTAVYELTSHVLNERFPADAFAVRFLSLEGNYVTQRWHRVLKDVWGATVVERYSMSEVFGGATLCPSCRGYHFDPHVVPEVVDRVTLKRLTEGVGVLLLTPLYPFVQLQPLIRYHTGDLFHVRPHVCFAPSYQFLGRADHSLFATTQASEPLISGVDLIEALDPFTDLARTPDLLDAAHAQFTTVGNVPRAAGRAAWNGQVLEIWLEVETVVNMRMFPERREEMLESLRASLVERCPLLSEALAKGSARLELEAVPRIERVRTNKTQRFWTQG